MKKILNKIKSLVGSFVLSSIYFILVGCFFTWCTKTSHFGILWIIKLVIFGFLINLHVEIINWLFKKRDK